MDKKISIKLFIIGKKTENGKITLHPSIDCDNIKLSKMFARTIKATKVEKRYNTIIYHIFLNKNVHVNIFGEGT